jgi:cytoskeleton protein RodZ
MSESYKKIGDVLKASRKEQNKALEDIAEATKIMEKHLRAIEEGDFESLPSPAYFNLFARSYAQNLGIDPGVIDEIQDIDLTRSTSSGQKDRPIRQNGKSLEETTGNDAKKFGRTLIWIAAIIISVFAIFLIYNFVFVNSSEPEHQATETEIPAVIESEIDTQKSPIDQNINATPYTEPPSLNMRMRAIQDVWTMVIMDGDTVMNRELKAGEVRNWEAKFRYRMTLGISTAVELSINGKRLAPLSSEPRTISNLEINQTNFEEFYPDEPAAGSISNELQQDTSMSPINPSSNINATDSGAPGEIDGN